MTTRAIGSWRACALSSPCTRSRTLGTPFMSTSAAPGRCWQRGASHKMYVGPVSSTRATCAAPRKAPQQPRALEPNLNHRAPPPYHQPRAASQSACMRAACTVGRSLPILLVRRHQRHGPQLAASHRGRASRATHLALWHRRPQRVAQPIRSHAARRGQAALRTSSACRTGSRAPRRCATPTSPRSSSSPSPTTSSRWSRPTAGGLRVRVRVRVSSP